MLEYADQGSLQDFFKQNSLPYDRKELHDLWMSLRNLFLGLAMIHNLNTWNDSDSYGGTIRSVHQDFKPANIFVFRESQGTSYSYRFKIGDFGMSSTELLKRDRQSTSSIDNQGTKMYAAPELTHHHPELAGLNFKATSPMDLWSLGCVLCEVLVWTICGHRGLEEFLHLRQNDANMVYPRHKLQGYSGCFHDSRDRIPAVDHMIRVAITRKRIFDDISEEIGHFLCDMILRPHHIRLDANQATYWLEGILDRLKDPRSEHMEQGPPNRSYTLRSDESSPLRQSRAFYNIGASSNSRQHTIDGSLVAHRTSPTQVQAATSYLVSQAHRTSIYGNVGVDPFGVMNPGSTSRMAHDRNSIAQTHGLATARVSSAPTVPSRSAPTNGPLLSVVTTSPGNNNGQDYWLDDRLSRTPPRLQGSPQESTLSPSPTHGSYLMTPEHSQGSHTGIGYNSGEISDEGISLQRGSSVRSHASQSQQPQPPAKPAVRFDKVTVQQVLEWKKRPSESRLLSLLPDYTQVMNLVKDRDQVCYSQKMIF